MGIGMRFVTVCLVCTKCRNNESIDQPKSKNNNKKKNKWEKKTKTSKLYSNGSSVFQLYVKKYKCIIQALLYGNGVAAMYADGGLYKCYRHHRFIQVHLKMGHCCHLVCQPLFSTIFCLSVSVARFSILS